MPAAALLISHSAQELAEPIEDGTDDLPAIALASRASFVRTSGG
jgi:hypothetical protein